MNDETKEEGGSPERFGYSWARYGNMDPIHEQQFLAWTAGIPREDWKNKTFLDCGCGMGRNSFWPMMYGAAGGLAVDLDERSLDAARLTLREFPSVEVRKASVYDLGIDDTFDICFSIGVIHHLEFPDRAIDALVRAAKPGGRVAIWVYGYENNEWIVRFFDPLRRSLFSRLPIGVVHGLSLVPAALLWAALRLGLGKLPYFNLIRQMSFPALRVIVFDQMLPRIAHYWRRDEVEALMSHPDLVDLDIHWVNDMSWAAIGRKRNDRKPRARSFVPQATQENHTS